MEDKCPWCGALEDTTPYFTFDPSISKGKPHYMCGSIEGVVRGPECYEAQLRTLRQLLREWILIATVRKITGTLVDDTKSVLGWKEGDDSGVRHFY